MEVGVGFAGFADPKEQVECSVCHKTAIYGDVLLSWWGSNQPGVLTCEDCMKAACGPEWDKVQDAVKAMRAVGGPDWEQSVKNAVTAIRNAKP